jgi:HlyD family secretion protein
MAKNGSSGWLKWLVVLIVLAALAGGAVWYFKMRGDSAVTYQTTAVTRGTLTQAVTSTGTLNPVLKVQVGSQISGRISRLYADFNSSVTSNQIIAEIDSSTYKASVQRAEADLSSTRASLELAQIETRRSSQLFSNNLVSGSDHDTAIANLHQVEATMQIKQAALDSAKVDLSRCTIFSPVEGVVISRDVDVGQTVAASMSAPVLFQIANDLTKMQIDANVAEADVGNVEDGQDVEFTVDAFPYRTFHGTVAQVRNAPTTVQNVVTYDAVISVTNADYKLKPGMTANVSVIIARREDVLKIPNSALRFRPPQAATPNATNTAAQSTSRSDLGGGNGGQRGQRGQGGQGGGGRRGGGGRSSGDRPMMMRTVYVLPAGSDPSKDEVQPKPVQIRVGISDGVATEVLEGLNEGDQIITGSNAAQSTTAQPASSPFGGGGGFRRF